MNFNAEKFVENQRKTRQQNIFNPQMCINLKLRSNINLEELVKQDKIKVLKQNLVKEQTNKLLDLFDMEYSLRNVEYLKKKYPFEKCGFKSVWENSATTADVIQVYPFSLNVPGVSSFEDFVRNQVNSNFEKKVDYFMQEKGNMKDSLDKKQKLKEEEEKLQELLNLEDESSQDQRDKEEEVQNQLNQEQANDNFNLNMEDLKKYYLLPYGEQLTTKQNQIEHTGETLFMDGGSHVKYRLDKQALDISAQIVSAKLILEITEFSGFQWRDVANVCEGIHQKFPWSVLAGKGYRQIKTNMSTKITSADNEKDDATILSVRYYQKNYRNFKNKINTLRVKRDENWGNKENKKFFDEQEVSLDLAESLHRAFHIIQEKGFREILIAFGYLVYQVIFMKLFTRDTTFINNLETVYLKSLEMWYSACNLLKKLASSEDLGIPVLLLSLRVSILWLFEKQFPAFFDIKSYRFKSEHENMNTIFKISYNNLLYDLLDCEGIYSTIPCTIGKIPSTTMGNYSNKNMSTKTSPFVKAMIYDSDALKDPIKNNSRTNRSNIVERMRRMKKQIDTI